MPDLAAERRSSR